MSKINLRLNRTIDVARKRKNHAHFSLLWVYLRHISLTRNQHPRLVVNML